MREFRTSGSVGAPGGNPRGHPAAPDDGRRSGASVPDRLQRSVARRAAIDAPPFHAQPTWCAAAGTEAMVVRPVSRRDRR